MKARNVGRLSRTPQFDSVIPNLIKFSEILINFIVKREA